MNRFVKLIIREFKLLSSNTVMLAVFIAAPVAYSLLIGAVYKNAKVTDLPVMVVDLDNSPLSHTIIDAINDNEFMEVAGIRQQLGNLRDEVLEMNYHAVITIPKGFEGDIQQKRHPEVDVDINATNMLTANYVTTGLMKVLGTYNAGIEITSLQKGGMPRAIAEQHYEAFRINMTRFFNPSSNYLIFLWPGMLGTILQQVFLLTIALSFAKELEENTFGDIFKVSHSPLFLLMAKAIPYWIIGIALWFPLMKISFSIFHIPQIANGGAYWLISSLFVMSLTFAGIAVSVAFKSQLKATEVLMVVATPSFIISGQTWPLDQMPQWIQVISNTIPLTHFAEAFRKLLMCDAGILDILPQLKALTIITMVSLATAIMVLGFRMRAYKKQLIKLRR